ncbi:uncharacterized protein NEMAJ01_1130 [Nematocida major]|uniref:uncharacterized protein n=1 Tax=Nematocida major TaxID=1912982 RepID=UPI0020081528|nr:uncharacterized protein NEMAJ01_1130 [Nematocida major]KAH9386234.1 hypothetical protein NEMAJ01_1130 [Nematocida major]
MKSEGKEEILKEIKELEISELKKSKHAIISRIVRGKFPEEDQIELRRELQKRFIKESEGKEEKHEAELAGTEEEIKKQCATTTHAAKKLAESDGKLCKVKRSQEKISEEMKKAEASLQKKKTKQFKEEILFLGAFGLFFGICCYILMDKFVLN